MSILLLVACWSPAAGAEAPDNDDCANAVPLSNGVHDLTIDLSEATDTFCVWDIDYCLGGSTAFGGGEDVFFSAHLRPGGFIVLASNLPFLALLTYGCTPTTSDWFFLSPFVMHTVEVETDVVLSFHRSSMDSLVESVTVLVNEDGVRTASESFSSVKSRF